MIETKMPKDIRKYKTKMIGPLTMRQLICVAIMGVVDIILYSLVIYPFELSTEFTIYGLILIDVPIGAFGWIEPQGLPLEIYLKDVVLRSFIAPAKRKPVRILYDKAQTMEKIDKKKTGKSGKRNKKAKKNPNEPKSFQ